MPDHITAKKWPAPMKLFAAADNPAQASGGAGVWGRHLAGKPVSRPAFSGHEDKPAGKPARRHACRPPPDSVLANCAK